MKDIYKPLFTPWHIGNVEIKNRIVLTSMGGTDLFGWMEKHHFDEEGAAFLLKAAENNAGLVLPGCQPVLNPVMGQWLYKNEKMYEDLAAWMPKFHATGAKLFVQLTAGFGRSFTVSRQFEKMYENPVVRQLTKPILDLDRITATASPSPNRWSDHLPSREMTVKEIRELSNADLTKKIDELKEELFNLRFQQATGVLENPARMKEIRKTIARIKTVLTERASERA